MYRLATRVTVFRDSQYIGTYDVDKITNADLIKAMVGREISDMYPKTEITPGEEVFRIEKAPYPAVKQKGILVLAALGTRSAVFEVDSSLEGLL